MPIFEYKCRKCGAEFEKLVKNSQEKTACAKCASMEVERKLSVFAASVAGASSCPAQKSCPAADSHKCSSGCCHLK